MNRLKDATSPYLRQHADNPVDWYPWGQEALDKAKAENKPILLSIGYSACHWCHVMAHESFEDPETAEIINRDFVAIKVDREERPDLDEIYMQATLIFNQGNGGWPMTVFLTPDGRPFHAGTYYPNSDRYGMPSFKRVMAAVIDAYHNRKEQVADIVRQVTTSLQRAEFAADSSESTDALTVALLEAAYHGIAQNFDPINGGLSKGRPKFPSPMNFEYVLRTYAHTDWPKALEMVTFSLRKMAHGGIYDQLGGGFHRYSVDEKWLVPHFEKMLYDNAQLSRVYLHTWQVSGDEFFKRVAIEIYDYILREMTSPEGGFFSTTDADSEGEEGKFFVWTPDEIRAILTPEEATTAMEYWDISRVGNFEGHNILHVPVEEDVVATKLGITLDTLHERIEAARDKLYAARTHRVHPGLDDKILTAWNGMMLASLAEAARVLDRDDYKQAALRNVEFILANLRKDGRLLRSFKDGKANFNGYLEDYANLIDGLMQVYQATFEPRYFTEALTLAEVVLKHFAASDGGFFDTSDDHEALITRPRNLQDNATPSGNSMIAKVFAQLFSFTGDDRFGKAARGIIQQLVSALQQYPQAFGEALNAADLLTRGIDEVAIVGKPSDTATKALLTTVNSAYRPNMILALTATDQDDTAIPALLAHRTLVQGKPAAYVCRHFTCLSPVTESDALEAALLDQKKRK